MGRISGLEVLRGYAALAVLLFHVEALCVPLPEGGFAETVVRTIGPMGVPLFFCLSAFSLLYGYHGRLFDEHSMVRFYVRRFFRIAPLFYVMIFAWAPFWNRSNEFLNVGPIDVLLAVTFLFWVVPEKVAAIVPAGWSLGVEWAFYFTFPLFALFARSVRASLVAFAICVVISLATGPLAEQLGYHRNYEGMSVLRHLMFFQVGIVAFAAVRHGHSLGISAGQRMAVIAATCALLILNRYAFEQPALHPTFMFAAVCGLWVICAYEGLPSWIDNPSARYLGRISYSVYLVHPLVLMLLSYSGSFDWIAQHMAAVHLRFVAAALLSFAATIAVASIAYRLIESPGIRLGDRLLRARGLAAPATARADAAGGAIGTASTRADARRNTAL